MAQKEFLKMGLAAAAVVFFAIGGFHYADAASRDGPASYKYLRIFYYRDNRLARASFLQHAKSVDVLAPQMYAVRRDGTLEGKVDAALLAFARKNNIKVMPLVTNKGFNQESGHAFLDDEVKQYAAISALVGEGKKRKFWGWQFDFEQLDAAYRDRYSAFIKKAAEELKKNNMVVSVAVVAQISDNPADYPKDLWQHTVGVYDYASLASSSDFISVMSYDDPESKGPIVRYPWMKQVIDYSLRFIPNGKLSLGIPLYYWKWDDAQGKLVGIGGYKGIKRALNKYYVTLGYSAEDEAPFMSYVSRNKRYTIWYENARSVAKKLELIAAYRLHGFSAWALGLEVPDIHRIVQKAGSAPGSAKNK